MSGLVVPRVARSLDELRVGMVVAMECLVGHPNARWEVGTLAQDGNDLGFRAPSGGWLYPLYRGTASPGQVVILSDPPRPAYRVPAEQVDALRAEIDEFDAGTHDHWPVVIGAARAVVFAAEVEENE